MITAAQDQALRTNRIKANTIKLIGAPCVEYVSLDEPSMYIASGW